MQEELFKAQTTWFHVFKSMIDNGDIAEMGPSATTIYLVIKAHANMSSGVSFPAVTTIVKSSGLSKKTVLKGIDVLVEKGYINKEKKGRNNVYTLREKIELHDKAGQLHSVASFDYVPTLVEEARAELKNFMLSGDAKDSKIVLIERLVMNVQINQGNARGNQNNLTERDLDALDKPTRKAVVEMMQGRRKEEK